MAEPNDNPIAAAWKRPTTPAAGFAAGRQARRAVPRRDLARLTTTGRDPLGILAEQNESRLKEFVPLRNERMAQSPFAFYRGTAALMAADLAADPHTGILVGSCGDAHVANFGFYASPQRTLVFDLNDFDEAAWAPWEWDLKRLVTSIVVSGQSTGRTQSVIDEAVLSAVRTYLRSMSALAARTPLERYFTHFEVDQAIRNVDKESRAALRSATKDAQKRTGARAVHRLTRSDERGRIVFVESPPTMVHVDPEIVRETKGYIRDYLESANIDISVLMARYVVSDVVRRVVGVGSVGTRCYLISFQAGDDSVLLLQSKEAGESVLAKYGRIEQPPELIAEIERRGQGARVVALQRLMQAFSDPFLGYLSGAEADLYMRQFHDMKGGLDTEVLETRPFLRYAGGCAVTLARAHAQSPAADRIVGYSGNRERIGEALLEWAYAYADLSRRDYESFLATTSTSA